MLKLLAEDFIQVDKIDLVLPLYQELVAKTKLEQGCIAYDLYHDLRDQGHFVFDFVLDKHHAAFSLFVKDILSFYLLYYSCRFHNGLLFGSLHLLPPFL